MNVILLCLLFPTISVFYFQKTSAFRDDQLQRAVADRTAALKNKAAYLMRSLSNSGTQAISGYNYTFLNDLTHKAVTSDPEFIGCQFVSRISTGVEQAGYGFPGTEQQAFIAQMEKITSTKTSLFKEEINEEEDMDVIYLDIGSSTEIGDHPVLVAVAPVYVGGKLWGTVNGSFSLEYLNRDVRNIREEWAKQMNNYKISFLTITLIFFIVGAGSAVILTRPLLRSIQLLREGVDRVSGGDLEHKIYFSGIACDEFIDLSDSFNEMTESLRLAKKQLDDYSRSLEDLVSERTNELREAQSELIAQAHEAGMAEMAVGVLHNIGNAITPVKVGTTSLIERMQNSPLRKNLKTALEKMPEAIQSASDIPQEEKEKIIRVMNLLPESIREEYDQIIDEIVQISEKHKYIENIISLQMHYARLKGRTDLVDINRVVQDALNMLSVYFQKYHIAVRTTLQEVAEVELEESKLLQILVNLIKNGCEAMAEQPDKERTLFITTTQSGNAPRDVILTVRDTGCGFTGEEKDNFFRFGYSTKKRGTGFGLHSSANYLIANNGNIEARSEGPGKGAEFIIRLPAAEKRT